MLESDLADDIYSSIMDLYDSGVDVQEIRQDIPLHRTDLQDDPFEHEIYVTVYAYAFWQLGGMDDVILEEVKRVIDISAGVITWNGINNKLGKIRAKELDNLLKKIAQPNPKPRARKKYKTVTKLYFNENDVLTYRLTSGQFYVAVCVRVLQSRGECSYRLVRTTWTGDKKPIIEDVRRSSVWGVKILSDGSAAETELCQPGVSRLWPLFDSSGYFFMGLSHISIPHKAMAQMYNYFEKIGTLSIAEPLNTMGSLAIAENFEEFETTHDLAPAMKKHAVVFPLEMLIDEVI